MFHFILNTRPDSKCRVTANTNTQLDTATWADIRKWGALKLTASRWAINTETTYHLGDRSNWFGIRATRAPENTTVWSGTSSLVSPRKGYSVEFFDMTATPWLW